MTRIRSQLLPILAACGAVLALGAAAAGAADYVPGEVLVAYGRPSVAAVTNIDRKLGIGRAASRSASSRVLHLPKGTTVSGALARLRRDPGVAYAVPDYIAHAAGSWVPDDPGRGHAPAGWEAVQWNFLPGTGVNAPEAWSNLLAVHRAGGGGVVVAVLDTGIAYRSWHRFKRSPDFVRTRFVAPHDFVSNNRYPLDREGHGTFVAGTVAESTNNGVSVTGLAYGASIMPVRVLDSQGNGDAQTIAKGIHYAVSHGANVINLSLEFQLGVTASDIPDMLSALNYARRRGVVVVGAAGNDSSDSIAYPARTSTVISVGATTRDRCLAEYSNTGGHLDLVAPGGGNDTSLLSDPHCHPGTSLPDIYQLTLQNPANPGRFGLPSGWFGTSMSTPHVAAAAALVIASGVIGPHPTPAQVLARLESTAQQLGPAKPNSDYGYGLLDAGAATRPGSPATPPLTRTTTTRRAPLPPAEIKRS